MFYFAIVILFFHLIVLYFWFINFSVLFNWTQVVIWLLSIVIGIIVNQKLNDKGPVKNLLSLSNWVMIFLVMVTIAIYFTTHSIR